ncbi:MAG: hypothetical protein K9G36_08990 [Crocinitomicaceae bacterium]|jgi:hypothetical protein|nr:hypothetical protein [Crocinitomicaceae bacterium]MCF8411507.1 hypothetical protein [Crocinitomicaceae bacterium]
MKTLKSLVLGFVLLSSTLSFGQKTAEERATNQTMRMKTELSLTDDQASKVKEINLGIMQKNERVTADNTIPETQKNEILKSNNEARMSMLKNVLTSEQYTKLELTIAQKKIERMKKREKVSGKIKDSNKKD